MLRLSLIFILLGQFLLGILFFISAFADCKERSATLALMRAKHIPLPKFALTIAIILKLVSSLCLLFNFYPAYGATWLAFFTLICNFIFVDFWNKPTAERIPTLLPFLTNLGVVGGLFLIIGVHYTV